MHLLSSFQSIQLGLMVGIGGGVPSRDADIRLGDVVVSTLTNAHGGVIRYDYGKVLSGGDFQNTSMLNYPPQILLTALSKLQANHLTGCQRFLEYLAEIERKMPKQVSTFARPDEEDHLYLADYNHVNMKLATCDGCNTAKTVPRVQRDSSEPVVHYGPISSANQAVKDSRLRDKLGDELGVYCVEMEAAGFMDNFSCLVIRGICDYADSHKNNEWQGYAAAVAAAYAKELIKRLLEMHPQWWIERAVKTASAMNDFFARNKLSCRVNPFLRRTSRPVYPGNDRQYLNTVFEHNLGWLTRFQGVVKVNVGILNLWAMLEFLDIN